MHTSTPPSQQLCTCTQQPTPMPIFKQTEKPICSTNYKIRLHFKHRKTKRLDKWLSCLKLYTNLKKFKRYLTTLVCQELRDLHNSTKQLFFYSDFEKWHSEVCTKMLTLPWSSRHLRSVGILPVAAVPAVSDAFMPTVVAEGDHGGIYDVWRRWHLTQTPVP